MRRWALGSTAALALGGCSDILGLGDFQAGDAGVAGSGGTTTTSTTSNAGGSGGATTSSTSSAGGSGGATTTSSMTGSGGGSACVPNEVRACDYAGPEGTAGVGLCTVATQMCAGDGSGFGACSGEVLPAIERCDTPEVDEDCDGLPACSGSFRWAKRYGDALGQLGNGVAIDAQGNVVVVGRFGGSVDFGGGALTATATDAFVVKLDRQGRHLWSRQLGGAADQVALAVGVDVSGAIVVTGTTTGAVDFGGGTLTAFGGTDVFALALDPDGNHLWSKVFGGPTADAPTSIAVTSDGALVIAGSHNGGMDFGGGALAATTTDAFAAKLSTTDGAYLWAKSWGDAGVDRVNGVAIDKSGNVLLTGTFFTKIDFGSKTLNTAGGYDLFVAKLASDGSEIWSKAFGDSQIQAGTSVTSDASGNVLLVGYAAGSFSVGGSSMVGSGDSTQAGFVAKLGPGGGHAWSITLGPAASPVVSVDGIGNVVVATSFNGALTFGGPTLNTAGANDYALGKLRPDGSHLWSHSFGNGADQSLSALAVGPAGEIAVAGGNVGAIDFGGGPLATAGANDAIVAELAP